MKTIACLILSIVALTCHGQERYVTLTIKPVPPAYPTMTNSLALAEGETAHLISMAPALRSIPAYAYVEKDEQTFSLADGPTQSWTAPGTPRLSMFPTPPAIAGPAKLMLVGQGGLATFRITPNFSDPQKTIILLPGAENAEQITLQCSTNLSTWVPATNGLYSGDVAKVLRIHLEEGKP